MIERMSGAATAPTRGGTATTVLAARLDRHSPVPLYHQLKALLIDGINSEQFRPGDQLPGEPVLTRCYGVSRTVVRQALDELEGEGLLERRKGRGTFVARPNVDQALISALVGLHEEVTGAGGRLRSDVRHLAEIPADPEVAAVLGLPRRAPVVMLERLRWVNGDPWALTKTWLPADLVPGITACDFTEQSLYTLLEERYGVLLDRGSRSVQAAAASAPVARALRLRPRDPVLVIHSVSRDAAARPVEYFVASHRGDRSRLDVAVRRRHRGDRADDAG